MSLDRTSIAFALQGKFTNVDGVQLPRSIETKVLPNMKITSNHCGLMLATVDDYTYLIINNRKPKMVTARVKDGGAKHDRITYVNEGASDLDPIIYRVEARGVIKHKGGGVYELSDALTVTVQSPSGDLEQVTIPAMRDIISRTVIHNIAESDGVPEHNIRLLRNSTLLNHSSDFEEHSPIYRDVGKGILISATDIMVTTFCGEPYHLNATDMVMAAAPLFQMHASRYAFRNKETLCTITEDYRIFTSIGGGCGSCGVHEGLKRAQYLYYMMRSRSGVARAIANHFLDHYMMVWERQFASIVEHSPCLCTDFPTAPSFHAFDAADEIAGVVPDCVDYADMPKLIPISQIDRPNLSNIRSPKRQRMNPEDSDYDSEA